MLQTTRTTALNSKTRNQKNFAFFPLLFLLQKQGAGKKVEKTNVKLSTKT
jgi:hypothetical protein